MELIRALAVFIFLNRGPSEVAYLAMLLLATWALIACIYVLLSPVPTPLFFGVPAHRAHWSTPDPFPRKWIGLLIVVGLAVVWKMIYP